MKLQVQSRAALLLCLLPGAACGSDAEREGGQLTRSDAAVEQPEPGVDASAGDDVDASSTPFEDADAPMVVQVDAAPKTCAEVETTPLRTIPSVTFLVDGSGSMNCVYPEDGACDCDGQLFKRCSAQGSVSRWQALSAALLGSQSEPGLIDSLGASVRFGLWIYNNAMGAAVCPGYAAQVAPALNQSAALEAAFPAKPPGFNTPTARALSELTGSLPDPAQITQQKLGPQTIVLATDGQPFTCQDPVTIATPKLDYQAVLDATHAAGAKQIDLYVMSLAPAAGDFAAHLNEVAQAGGSTHAYTPANKGELSAALEEIIAGAISCTVELSGRVERPEQCRGRATLGDRELVCGAADGFALLDATHAELRGEACRRFKHEPGIALKMFFPCDAFGLQ